MDSWGFLVAERLRRLPAMRETAGVDPYSLGLSPSCLHPAVCPQASHITTLNLSLFLWTLVLVPVCRVVGKSECA